MISQSKADSAHLWPEKLIHEGKLFRYVDPMLTEADTRAKLIDTLFAMSSAGLNRRSGARLMLAIHQSMDVSLRKRVRVADAISRLGPRIALALLLSFASAWFSAAHAEPNCNTALSRIAKAAVLRAIDQNKHTACSGFKQGQLAIDETRTLRLDSFQLCEDGAVVSAKLSVLIECATSSNAFIKTSVGDTLSAEASADLDKCTVSGARAWGSGFLTNVGLNWSDVDRKLKEAAEKEIQPYCTKLKE